VAFRAPDLQQVQSDLVEALTSVPPKVSKIIRWLGPAPLTTPSFVEEQFESAMAQSGFQIPPGPSRTLESLAVSFESQFAAGAGRAMLPLPVAPAAPAAPAPAPAAAPAPAPAVEPAARVRGGRIF